MKLSKSDYLKIKKNILKKLYFYGAFRKGHLLYEMSEIKKKISEHAQKPLFKFAISNIKLFSKLVVFDRLQKGIPPHLKGFIKEVLEDLIKEELVLFYGKTKYGDAYQLNINKLKEIEEIILK